MDPWLEAFARTAFARSSDTAHDLKTPLNVAVLNLELLRLRVRKLAGSDDAKINEYSRAIDMELRRMAEIFDTFFVLSTPPRGEDAPLPVDAAPIVIHVAEEAGFPMGSLEPAMVRAHEARIRQAFKLFFHGASKVLSPKKREVIAGNGDPGAFSIRIAGVPEAADFELARLFKFYYTAADGTPDLSLAAARLIVETYGGELNAAEESDKVTLRLSLPLGD